MRCERSESPASRARLSRWVLLFQLANTLLLCVVAIRYFAFTSLPAEWLGRLFLALAVPGHFLVLTSAVAVVVLLPALVFPGRWVFPWAVVFFAALFALVLIDTVVFSLYRFHIDGIVLSLVFSGVADEILPISASAYAPDPRPGSTGISAGTTTCCVARSAR